jgi:hypothetical protein
LSNVYRKFSNFSNTIIDNLPRFGIYDDRLYFMMQYLKWELLVLLGLWSPRLWKVERSS